MRGDSPGVTSRRPSELQAQREQDSQGLQVRPSAEHHAGTYNGSGLWQVPPAKRGKPPVPVTSVHPEAPDNLLGAVRDASIDEEHRTIMSAVIQKVQSAKSGLTEACASLLTSFEVSI